MPIMIQFLSSIDYRRFIMKKTIKYLLLSLMLSMLFSMGSQAAVTSSRVYKAEKALTNYYKRHYEGKFPYVTYGFYDMNGDGINEMLVKYEGRRTIYRFFIYYRGKVTKLHSRVDYKSTNGIAIIKKYKYFVVNQMLYGTNSITELKNCYRIRNGKFQTVSQYKCVSYGTGRSSAYYKNGKRISKQTYDAFEKKCTYLIWS